MLWSLLAFLALSAGHAELWIAFVNRMYGLPIHIKNLHRIRAIHDVAIVAFPVLLYWLAGVEGPLAFFTGRWETLSAAWIAIDLACSAGFCGLMLSIVTWWVRSLSTATYFWPTCSLTTQWRLASDDSIAHSTVFMSAGRTNATGTERISGVSRNSLQLASTRPNRQALPTNERPRPANPMV